MANKKKIIGPILLISAAMIWGLSFVAQKQGMEYVEGNPKPSWRNCASSDHTFSKHKE